MKVKDISLCGLFAALLSVCAWLSFPVGEISVTLQTLAAFLALGLLGGFRGTVAIAVYLFMGAVGLPVFSGFRGGFSVLLGPSGGYLWGFLLSGLLFWLLTSGSTGKRTPLALILAQLLCYCVGSLWYFYAWLPQGSFIAILLTCVVPYLLPDAIKLFLAIFLIKRIKPFV